MMNRNRLFITIRPVPNEPDRYIAMFSPPVLSSTFSVVFPDSITGALAVHDFAEMLRLRYERPVEIELETDPVPPRSKAMEDVLAAMRVSVPVGSGHSHRIRSATGAV